MIAADQAAPAEIAADMEASPGHQFPEQRAALADGRGRLVDARSYLDYLTRQAAERTRRLKSIAFLFAAKSVSNMRPELTDGVAMRKISLIAISLAFVTSTAMADETAATWRLEAQHQNYTVYAGSLKRVRICSTNQPVSVSWGSRQHTVVSPKSCADIEGEQIVLGNQGVVAAEGTYMVLSR